MANRDAWLVIKSTEFFVEQIRLAADMLCMKHAEMVRAAIAWKLSPASPEDGHLRDLRVHLDNFTPRNVPFRVEIDTTLKARLEAAARAEKRTNSQWTESALVGYLKLQFEEEIRKHERIVKSLGTQFVILDCFTDREHEAQVKRQREEKSERLRAELRAKAN